jgi:hypothetical protein
VRRQLAHRFGQQPAQFSPFDRILFDHARRLVA